jgi:methylthioribose-1-phosphate isomerase
MEDGIVHLIDQPRLPHEFQIARMLDHRQTASAISTMIVRGAGAIGATGAYGMAQAVLEAESGRFSAYIEEAAERLRNTRPTAQNLFYGIEKVLAAVAGASSAESARIAAVEAAEGVAEEDSEACKNIGIHGAPLIPQNGRISTHCNAGWLAFVDWGSAISPIYAAHRMGKKPFVFVDETRPRSQGARLTAWELAQEGIDHAVIADNATGHFLQRGDIDLVIVGADRIAMNGDVANKIGTYTSALAAKANGIPFYVAAPTATIDPRCPNGGQIPIEERHQDEVRYTWGWSDDGSFTRVRTTPAGSPARNPAFDVTPAELITAIITEKGVIPPGEVSAFAPSLEA